MATVEPGEWRCLGCGRAYSDRAPGDLCPHDERVLVPAATAERFGSDALLGRSLADNYLIFDILGLGGFGAVYRAIDRAHDRRQVAIKTIRPGAERHNADARARFTQEARLLERLRDPHIVQVYHYGEADDALFMALELVPGRSLKRILRSKKRLSPRQAVHITAQILEALTHAHALGLVHRDLKPANILVVEHRDDTVKVIDFGIAKVLEAEDDDEGPKTGTGLVLGTVRYMAPEQLRQGGQVGSATDCYAVGIMFYEMLAGQAPFDGSQAEIAAAHLYQPAPRLDEALAPPTLRAWIERVLLKNPADRFADAAEMREALLAALPGSAAVETAEPTPIEGPPGDAAPGDAAPSGSMDGLSGPSASARAIVAGAGDLDGAEATEASDALPASTDEPAPASTLPDGAVDAPPADAPDAAPDAAPDDSLDAALDAALGPASSVDDPGEGSMTVESEVRPAPEAPVEPAAARDPSPELPPDEEGETLLEPPPIMGAEQSVVIDPDLAALPTLDPGGPMTTEASPAWGDIDVSHAPTALRETSGTIQAARGELGLVDPPDEGRRPWWLVAAALAGVAMLALALVPWVTGEDGGDAGPVETIRLSVGDQPPPLVPTPDVALPDAAPAAVDADPADGAPATDGARPVRHRAAMGWRQIQRYEDPILEALSTCRCSQARRLHDGLPRAFPQDRARRLGRRVARCKLPLVDQQCVDGEVK